MSITESAIKWNISLFAKYMGIQPTNNDIVSFMKIVHEKRKLQLSPDIFYMVCSYLNSPSIIVFTTCCKSHMRNYENIWGLFAKNLGTFPASNIHPKDFRTIRKSIGVDQYHIWSNYNNLFNYDEEKQLGEIRHEEDCIAKLYEDVKKLTPLSHQYKVTKLTNIGEIKARIKDRDVLYENLPDNIKDFLKNFQFVSISIPYCTYYTIKQITDTRLYGFDNELEDGKILIKWITGEYTTKRDYINNWEDGHLTGSDPDVYDYINDVHRHEGVYRKRRKPHFVGVALNGWCQCTCWCCQCECEELSSHCTEH